ncbi:MAG TPA: nucleoside-diphosphate sugar epimerase/dehydratase [Armatimonadota bacterium]
MAEKTASFNQTSNSHGTRPAPCRGREFGVRVGAALAALERRIDVEDRDYVKIAVDIVLIALAAAWSWAVVMGREVSLVNTGYFVAIALVVRLAVYGYLHIWKYSWRQVAAPDILQLSASAVLAMPLFAIALYLPYFYPGRFLLPELGRPSILLLTEPAFYMLFLCAARLAARVGEATQAAGAGRIPVLVVGAGSTGAALGYLLEEVGDEYTVVGYLDEDPHKVGRRLRGKPVLGGLNQAAALAQSSGAEIIVIAQDTLGPDHLRQMLLALEATGLPLRTVPPMSDVITHQARLDDLREINMEDLLPRNEVRLDCEGISEYLAGKTVMVTGGGGSIGRQLCRRVVECGAARVVVLGRGENSVFEAVQELNELDSACEIVPVICCVRDRTSLQRVFEQFSPQVVFHAAAHKHVPLMELYPAEAIKNNVGGTLNLVQLCVRYRVERFVLVSTDKAVNPVSIMGASKRVAEEIVRAYAQESTSSMVSVRFGNVLGSRGSVVPTMTRQIRNRRPVTITHPDMLRYFMTIPEAVQLILEAGASRSRGETYVLKMGHPVKILDLACDLIRLAGLTPHVDVPIQFVGCRPGEKLKEELFTGPENDWVEAGEHFYVVPGRRLGLDYLLHKVRQLARAADDNDRERITDLLQEVIPDYKPAEAVGKARQRSFARASKPSVALAPHPQRLAE